MRTVIIRKDAAARACSNQKLSGDQIEEVLVTKLKEEEGESKDEHHNQSYRIHDRVCNAALCSVYTLSVSYKCALARS